jgi:hypothetical protein
MFAIRHETEQDGVSREFIVYEVEPIGLVGFCEHLAGGKNTFHVRARARVHSAPDLPTGTKMRIGHTVVFSRALHHYALVRGGVLPPDYLLRGGTRLMMDRNVVSDLRRMPAVDNGAPHPLRWLNSEGFHVNPILGAIEGSRQRPMSRNEFKSELVQTQQVVRQRLPRAKSVEFSGKALQAMYQAHRHFVGRLTREANFLLAVSERLADTVSNRDLRTTEQFVLRAAAQARLRPLTLIVLTALAKLYEGNQDRPAGGILKLAQLKAAGRGWKRCAYNAIADVRQMELLSTGSAMPDYVAALTGDLGLAKVWCGLRPTGVHLNDGTIGVGFDLDSALFPRLEGSLDELLDRVRRSDGTAA